MGRDWRDELIDELRAVIARQQAEIEDLKKRVAELEEKLRTSSRNSSKPPSSDGPSKLQRRRPKRKRGKRNPGGQPGHEKHDRELIPTEQADKLTVVKPEQCERCSKPLVEYNQDPVRHQQVELPPVKPWVHEHQLHAGWCEDCGGRPIPVKRAPRRAGDSPILVADSRRIRGELGWRPAHSDLPTILESAWRWHQELERLQGAPALATPDSTPAGG